MKSSLMTFSSLRMSNSQMRSSFLNRFTIGGGENNLLRHSLTNLYATTNNSLIKEFILQKNHFSDEISEKRPGIFNRNGFVAALVDGFNTDGTKRLEITLPESADLSLVQKCGFSVFFWILIKKQPEGVSRFIVKRGNSVDELTPTIGVLPNGTNFFIKIMSSKHRIETLLSNKKIDQNRLYSLAVTFSIDYIEQLTDVSLYLDGFLDSQISVPGEPLHNQGSMWIGQPDSTSYGFAGCIADIILVPRVLLDEEILGITREGLTNISLTKGKCIKTYEIFSKRFERMVLMEKYIKYTETPVHVIENLKLTNDELREIVKNFDEEERIQDSGFGQEKSEKKNEEENMINLLKEYKQSDDFDSSIEVKKLSMNIKFIYTVLLLANKSEDSMEANRILTIFEVLSETLHICMNKTFLLKLAEIFNSIVPGTKTEIMLHKFFTTLKTISEKMFEELKNTELNTSSTGRIGSPRTAIGLTENKNSVELHENLLLNSQIFKNYIDDDIERELGKSSFVIKSLYTKPKTAPMRKPNGEGDLVNHFDEIIPKKEENEYDQKTVNRQSTAHENLMQARYDFTALYEQSQDNPKEGGKLEKGKIQEDPVNKVIMIIEEKKNNVTKDEIISDQIKQDNMKKTVQHKEEDMEKIKLYEFKSHQIESEKGDQGNPQNLPNIQGKETDNNQSENPQSTVFPQVDSQVTKQPTNIQIQDEASIVPSSGNPSDLNQQEKQNLNPSNAGLINPLEHNQEISANQNLKQSQEFSEVHADHYMCVTLEQPKIDENSIKIMDPQHGGRKETVEEEIVEQRNAIDPKYPSNWNEGAFEIIINHCYDCHTHKKTTRHFEYSFISKYNEIGEAIRQVFPRAFINGNYEDLEYFGAFDVYLRGVGPKLDDKGRYFIYRKLHTKQFPSCKEITDKLIALSMLYGSSVNMESAQQQYLKEYSLSTPEKSKHSHEFPAYLNETAEKIKEENEKPKINPQQDDPENTKLSCLNWGCTSVFVKVENGPDKCLYHPGVWQFGSYQGYWPEAWSCCERGWDDEGCTRGPHQGVRLDKRIHLCINHGEVDPRTHYPNSACGKQYTIKEDDTCRYHSGYITENGTWSCCRAKGKLIAGCFEGKHSTAAWPNEKAKLYFYPKQVVNAGLKYGKDSQLSSPLSVANKICHCDFFKPIVRVYENPATKLSLLKMKREKEKDEPRYCLNWTCESVYKEPDNHDKACRCHPGKWDHGSTGTKMKAFICEMNQDPKHLEKVTILWKPHWTCCRRGWNEPGCKKKRHRGPLLSDLANYEKKYKWPDIRLKLSFTKVVTDKWKDFIQQYSYSQDKVNYICKQFFSEGKKALCELPELCDNLRLYLLVVNENVEYQMKFMDIATQSGTVSYFLSKDGTVEPEKFMKWWWKSYEKIVEELNSPMI